MGINFRSNRRDVGRLMDANKTAALTAVGEFVEGASKLNSAVDTGNYRDSWGYRVDGDAVTIGNGVEYSIYLEKGTSRMAAQPALLPAVEGNASAINRIIEGAWRM